MLQTIKEFLKRILPPPVKSFMREITSLRELIVAQSRGLAEEQKRLAQRQKQRTEAVAEEQRQQRESVAQLLQLAEQQSEAQEKLMKELAFQRQFLLQLTDTVQLQGRCLESLIETTGRGQEAVADVVRQTGGELAARIDREEEALSAQLREQQARLTAELAQAQEKLAAVLDDRQTVLREDHAALTAAVVRTEENLTAAVAEAARVQRENHAALTEGQTALQEWTQEQNVHRTQQAEWLTGELKTLTDGVEKTRAQAQESKRNSAEAMWAEIFNNTITGSTWLKDTAFSPSGWAVGYPYLYAMYRVLDGIRPKRILDIGLGQTTRMIAQYAMAYEGVEHTVVENDADWIDVFQNQVAYLDRTEILRMDLQMTPYREADEIRTYCDFGKILGDRKFDFISVDAPWSGDMKLYARIDILQLLPGCLTDDFVIMVHDTERSGEKRMTEEIQRILREHHIEFSVGKKYSGKKDSVMICAKRPGFLTTL